MKGKNKSFVFEEKFHKPEKEANKFPRYASYRLSVCFRDVAASHSGPIP